MQGDSIEHNDRSRSSAGHQFSHCQVCIFVHSDHKSVLSVDLQYKPNRDCLIIEIEGQRASGSKSFYTGSEQFSKSRWEVLKRSEAPVK